MANNKPAQTIDLDEVPQTVNLDEEPGAAPKAAAPAKSEGPGLGERIWQAIKPWAPLEDLSNAANKVVDTLQNKSEELQQSELSKAAHGGTPNVGTFSPRAGLDLAGRVAHMAGGLVTPKNAAITAG